MAQKQIRPTIYFTSDIHKGHKNILNYCRNRKFDTVEDMEVAIIKRWNNTVKPEDLVIILGDLWMCKNPLKREFIDKLNGRKVLIRGNHDEGANKFMNKFGFEFACEEALIYVQGIPLRLSHYPYRPSLFARFKGWLRGKPLDLREWKKRPPNRGEILGHGHTHSTKKVSYQWLFWASVWSLLRFKKPVRGWMIHLGMDAWGLCPVSIDKIASIMAQIKREGEYRE